MIVKRSAFTIVFTNSFRTKNLRVSRNVYLRAPYNSKSKHLLFFP